MLPKLKVRNEKICFKRKMLAVFSYRTSYLTGGSASCEADILPIPFWKLKRILNHEYIWTMRKFNKDCEKSKKITGNHMTKQHIYIRLLKSGNKIKAM